VLLLSSLASRKKPAAVTWPLPPSIVTPAATNERGPSLIGVGEPPEPLAHKRPLRWKIRAYAEHKHSSFFLFK